MGDMGAAMSMGRTMGNMGAGTPSAGQVTGGLPPSYGAYGGALGADPTANSAGGGYGGGGGYPGAPGGMPSGGMGGAPSFPPMGGGPGMVAGTGVINRPFHWGDMRGEDFVRELQRRPTVRPRSRIRGQRNIYRRPLAKYKVPPRGFLSYYLQQDRFKITMGHWRYVSIEDDRAKYPTRFYYRPNSPTMLALLASSPRGIRRYNRVIGFKTWRDAMIAGYRPDPVSKPEPAARVLQLAGLTRSNAAMRYIEAAYAGQMSPEQFNSGVIYAGNVVRAVRSNRATRGQARQLANQAVLALLGEGQMPTQVVGYRRRRVRVTTTTTTMPGMGMQGMTPPNMGRPMGVPPAGIPAGPPYGAPGVGGPPPGARPYGAPPFGAPGAPPSFGSAR
jgi:hypothetical protein